MSFTTARLTALECADIDQGVFRTFFRVPLHSGHAIEQFNLYVQIWKPTVSGVSLITLTFHDNVGQRRPTLGLWYTNACTPATHPRHATSHCVACAQHCRRQRRRRVAEVWYMLYWRDRTTSSEKSGTILPGTISSYSYSMHWSISKWCRFWLSFIRKEIYP